MAGALRANCGPGRAGLTTSGVSGEPGLECRSQRRLSIKLILSSGNAANTPWWIAV
jgi:hypothetical protein